MDEILTNMSSHEMVVHWLNDSDDKKRFINLKPIDFMHERSEVFLKMAKMKDSS